MTNPQPHTRSLPNVNGLTGVLLGDRRSTAALHLFVIGGVIASWPADHRRR